MLDSGEKVSVDSILRMVGEGIFRAGGEEEYRRRLREKGVELDYRKLGEMLLEQRRLPEEVYRALKSLAGEGEREERQEGKATPAQGDYDSGATPLAEEREEARGEQRTREQQLRERELGLEDLLLIVSNVVRGVAYSLSRREFQKLLRDAVKKCGGGKRLAERLKKPSPTESRLLYEVVRSEVPLELFAAVLKLAEEAQRIEERVREMVEKTRKLLEKTGLKPPQSRRSRTPDNTVEEEEEEGEGGAEDPVEELRRRGYAYLGRRLGEQLSGEGLLDDWILDLIAACERPPTTRKEGFEEVLERLRRAWKKLGIDAERALAPLIEEVYEELRRSELLILLYNGRTDPSGRRGRAASFVDVLEILVEAARKAGGVERFLEIVRKNTGRIISPHLLDDMLAARRLDKDVLRVALEYVYENEEDRRERLRLLQKNTDYILKRLTEEARFLSRLESLLEPLAELNSRLEQTGQLLERERYAGEQSESARSATTPGRSESPEKQAGEAGTEQETGVAQDTGEEESRLEAPLQETEKRHIKGAYTNIGELWDAILKGAVYLLEYTDAEWRVKKPIIPPVGPIINLGSVENASSCDENVGSFGYESSRFLFNILRIMQNTFRTRTRGSKIFPTFTRSQLANLIGKHYREIARIASHFPSISIDDALRVFIFDTTIALVDPTTGIVFLLDDKEQPIGFWDFGITVQLSLVQYGDRDGGYIDETFIIQNDPVTRLCRKLWLEQVDSNGQQVITEDRLLRLGLAYKVKVGNQYLIKSCIDYDTGELTDLVLWDMGLNPETLEPAKIIDLTRIPSSHMYEERFDTGKYNWKEKTFSKTGEAVVWAKRTQAGDKIILNLLRQNIDYLIPQTTNVKKDPASIQWSPHKKPNSPYAKWDGSHLSSLLDNLMFVFGVNEATQNVIRNECTDSGGVQGGESLKKMKYIAQMLNGRGLAWLAGMTPNIVSFEEFSNVFKQTFVEQSFKAYLEHGRHVNDKGEMTGSDRYALEMLLGSGVHWVNPSGSDDPNKRTKPIIGSFSIDPAKLCQTVHPGYSFPRGDTPLFKVPASRFKGLLPESVKPDKNGYIFLGVDIAASEEKGIPVVFVPIFKENSPITHDNYPSDVIKRRTNTTSPVPIESITQDFWSSIEKYAVFTYDINDKEFSNPQPLTKPGESNTKESHIYSETEYTPLSPLEVFHMISILENLCSITTTHTSANRSTGEPVTKETLSPAYFFSQIKGYLIDNPKKGLKLFKQFGGDKILAELRKIKPIIPYTNKAQLGWFTLLSKREETMESYPECAKDIYLITRLWASSGDQVPTQIDLFIILLSYTGAQRARSKLKVILPIEILQKSSSELAYKIGSAIFHTRGNDLQLLDKIGVPIDENGKSWKKWNKNVKRYVDKKFTQLTPEEQQQVRGIRTHTTLEPVDIREVFGGRVKGVPQFDPQIPREKQNPEIFHNLLKFTEIMVPAGGASSAKYSSGYYSFVKWLTKDKSVDSQKVKNGKDLLNAMDNFIQEMGRKRSANILELRRDSLTNKYFRPLNNFFTNHLRQNTRITPSEKHCLNWFGAQLSSLQSQIREELLQILQGNILEALGDRHALDFIAESFMWSENQKIQDIGIR
ncbi:MAG: hypothetical protein Q6352_002345 [Candidatus Freyrarchaeum guaymaensis]